MLAEASFVGWAAAAGGGGGLLFFCTLLLAHAVLNCSGLIFPCDFMNPALFLGAVGPATRLAGFAMLSMCLLIPVSEG